MSTSSNVRASMPVLLFASYADAFQASRLEVPVALPGVVRDLVDAMRGMPGGARLPAVPLVAVNRVWVNLDSPIQSGDEIALIPPVAGG